MPVPRLPPAQGATSGSSLVLDPDRSFSPMTKASCAPGQSAGFVFGRTGLLSSGGRGITAWAFNNFSMTSGGGTSISFMAEEIYQFDSPENASAFLSDVRACLVEEKPLDGGVVTTPVDGDQAVSATLQGEKDSLTNTIGQSLFVLHGRDILALSISSQTPATNLSQ